MIQDLSIISLLLCAYLYSDKTLVVQFTPKAANNKRIKAVSLTLICFFSIPACKTKPERRNRRKTFSYSRFSRFINGSFVTQRFLTHLQPNLAPSSRTHGAERLMRRAPALAHVPPQKERAPCRAPLVLRPRAPESPHQGPSLDHQGPSLQGLGPSRPVLWAAPLVLGQDHRPQAVEALLAVKEGYGVKTATRDWQNLKDRPWNCSSPDLIPARYEFTFDVS